MIKITILKPLLTPMIIIKTNLIIITLGIIKENSIIKMIMITIIIMTLLKRII